MSASFDPPDGFKDSTDDYFPIIIKTMTGKKFEVYVSPSDTVKVLKMIIHDKEGIPPHQQRLIVGGQRSEQMEECKLLSHYGIENFSVVHVVLRLRGGMFHRAASRSGFNLLVDNPLCVSIKYGPNSSDELELELHGGKFALQSAVQSIHRTCTNPNIEFNTKERHVNPC